MLQRIRDVLLLVRLGRVRGYEARHDHVGALRAIESISYSGRYSGLVAAYTTRLLAMTRDERAFGHVRNVRRFIREHEAQLAYADYCLAYCDYLECVLLRRPHAEAGAEVLRQKSSSLVRRTLLVI